MGVALWGGGDGEWGGGCVSGRRVAGVCRWGILSSRLPLGMEWKDREQHDPVQRKTSGTDDGHFGQRHPHQRRGREWRGAGQILQPWRAPCPGLHRSITRPAAHTPPLAAMATDPRWCPPAPAPGRCRELPLRPRARSRGPPPRKEGSTPQHPDCRGSRPESSRHQGPGKWGGTPRRDMGAGAIR